MGAKKAAAKHEEAPKAEGPHPAADGTAADGSKILLQYTGTFEDGTVFDSSEGRDPLSLELGKHQVIPGFEKAVYGMKVGEKKQFTLPPEEAYGPRNEQLIQVVPKDALGELKDSVKVGMVIGLNHPMIPQPIPAMVTQIGDDSVTIDLNPPLAGKTLTFAIEIVKIE